jgi:hypothetical protein
MGILTGTNHGDAATSLLGFYIDKAKELEEAKQYYMAAVALSFGVETAIIAYLLVEFGEDNGGELQIPDRVGFFDLIEAANEVGVLGAPINVSSHIREDGKKPKHIAKDVVDKMRKFRNLIHPAVALRNQFDPAKFRKKQLNEFKNMFESIMHSLMYYL